MNIDETVITAAHRLQSSGTPYALVSVVRALAPASARPGDKAVVTADGQMLGWVGGGCAQPAVLRTVRQVLAEGQARLIRIAPTAQGHEKDLGDVLEFGMSCHSGGTLELFIDPVLPRPRLIVIGASPVAQSLVELAPRTGFSVTLIAHEADRTVYADAQCVITSDEPAVVVPQIAPGGWVVVATQGRRDLQALRLALVLQARQIAFVASARKAQVLKGSLIAAGADGDHVAAIVAPAGLPMAAETPQEIALSVLAAIVAQRRRRMTPDSLPEIAPVDPATTGSCHHADAAAAADVDAGAADVDAGGAAADAGAAAPARAPLPAMAAAPAGHSCCGGH